MTGAERDAEARDKRRVEALERIAEAMERKPARVPVAATTVRDGTQDIAVVVCADGTVRAIRQGG